MVLRPVNPIQYELPLSGEEKVSESPSLVLVAYPTTVYFWPLSVKRVPDVFTKPVAAGGAEVEVGLGVLVGCVDVGVVVGDGVAPGRHCQ